MTIDQAVVTATEFLDDYLLQNRSFTTTDSMDDYRLDFQQAERGDDGALVLVFGVRPSENTDDPSLEIQALATRCRDALVAAHPELARFDLVLDYMN